MFDLLSRLGIGGGEPGLPPSLLRDNSFYSSGVLTPQDLSGYPPAGSGALPGPISEAQALENVNAAKGGRRFAANFIEPGPVLYKGKNPGEADEMVNLTEEVLARMAPTFVGMPVIDWDHAETWPEILGDGAADGVVYDVWKGPDGWWHCGFMLWTKSSIEHALSGDWSVSCAWKTIQEDATPGRWHNIDYTQTLLDGVYTHLALVKNPRYENARIRANSSGNGGLKMAWEIFKKKKPEVLRVNSVKERVNEADGAPKLNVDGEAVSLNDLVAKHNAMRKHADDHVLNAEDDDEVEVNGVKYNVGELRNAHRMHKANARHNEPAPGERAAAHVNAEPEEKKEEKLKENRRNDVQLAGAGSEKTGKLAGSGTDKQEPVVDNPDKTLEAANELAKAKERLNSLEKELKELKGEPSRELRDAGAGVVRASAGGGVPQDMGFMDVSDRIRAGNRDFAVN
jgi:Uncharacterized protein conserved in bacteria (DUF2213)